MSSEADILLKGAKMEARLTSIDGNACVQARTISDFEPWPNLRNAASGI